MTASGVESATESFRNFQLDGNDSRLSSGALALLKEGQGQFNQSDSARPSSLPEVSFAAPGVQRVSARDTNNPNLAMGNPSGATPDVANADNYLIVRDQYTMSYNKDHKTPNWVSWQLDSDWLGSVGRTGPFVPDQSLPAGFGKASPKDYTNSGYDRGHNIPSGDRTKSTEDNETTFLMSNVAPQTADNNRGPWEKFESYCRELAGQGKELYIVDGSTGTKGTISDGINVPDEFWKVVVVLPQKGMTAADVNADTQVIAVEVPNVSGIRRDDWRKYTSTVSDIEKRTGYHFLSNLSANVANSLENKSFSNQN